MPTWKGVIYKPEECLPLFVRKLPTKYLLVFKKYINHDYPLTKIEPRTCYIYCGRGTPKKAGEVTINTDQDYVPLVFFDRAWDSNSDPEEAIYLYLTSPEHYKKPIGFFYKDLKTLILTDFTHNSDCVRVALDVFPKIIEALKLISTASSIVFTQKAKGIEAITHYTPETVIINSYTQENVDIKADQLFIRACPKNPRHGVMESIIVPNTPLCIKTAIDSMFKQAITFNEPPEVIIQPYIQAKANAVVAPGAFVIAPGHDGVTAGKGKQVILPLPEEFELYNEIKNQTKLDEFEIEAIATEKVAYLVQVRKANKHFKPNPKPKNALPGFTHGKVINLEEVNPIVIEGLENIEKLEGTTPDENTVCFHINGNILSHAAAHCRQTGIPYVVLTNRKIPTKGYLWEVTKGWVKITETPPDETAKYEIDWNWLFFLTGLDTILQGKITTDEIKFLWNNIILFHYYLTGQATSEWNAYLAGTFAGALLKTTLAICMGEIRHACDKCYDTDGQQLSEALMRAVLGKGDISDKYKIYEIAFNQQYSLETTRNIGKVLEVIFSYKWASDYGGPKWKAIAQTLTNLPNLINSRSETLTQLNNMLNLCHNTAWAYSKLISKKVLDVPYSIGKGEISFYTIEQIMLGYVYGMKPYQTGENSPKKIIVKEGK